MNDRSAWVCLCIAVLQGCTHAEDLDTVRRSMAQGGNAFVNTVSSSPSESGAAGQAALAQGNSGSSTWPTFDSAGASDSANAFQPLGVRLPRGVPALATRLTEFAHYDEHDRSLVPELIEVDEASFAFAQRFPYGSGDGHDVGSAGFFGPMSRAVQRSDLLRAFFWARCVMPEPGGDTCRLRAVFEEVSHPYRNDGLEWFGYVGSTWSLYSQVFASMQSYAAGEVQLTFHLGYPNQSLELGPVGLENYGTSLSIPQLESVASGTAELVIAPDAFFSYGDAVAETRLDLEYPFGRANRFSTVGLAFQAPESSGYQGRNARPVREHDATLVTFWARCLQSTENDGSCRTAVVFEATQAPYKNAGLSTPIISIGPDWQQYFFPFAPTKSFEIEQAKLGLRLGYSEQILELGPITVTQYGSDVQVSGLPQSFTEE
jgi:hypothetical protein